MMKFCLLGIIILALATPMATLNYGEPGVQIEPAQSHDPSFDRLSHACGGSGRKSFDKRSQAHTTHTLQYDVSSSQVTRK